MTDKPTLSLDSAEWRAMLGHNLNRAGEFVQSTAAINQLQVKAFHDHLDRMKALVSAWYASAPAAVADAVAEQAQPEAPAHPQANGAAPKRKGGWPLGKKRKQRVEARAVQ